jgi:flagellar basal-body rod protein FlgG
MAQQERIDSVANDLANANTNGYKHTRVGFEDLVYTAVGRAQRGNVREGVGVRTVDAGRSFEQGALRQTGEPLDVAIQGPGFLRVRLADGRQALTRDGALHVDGRGRIVTGTGALVQPPITVPAGVSEDQISISPSGAVTAGGRTLGRLELVTVRAPGNLLSAGDNAFVTTAASGRAVAAPRSTSLSQGALEGSNVDMADEMVELVDAQRSYELASKAITTADEMAQIANQVRK